MYKKDYRKAKRMQFTVGMLMKLKGKTKADIRYVQTSQGNIRILEYGFKDQQIKPLFIDMHGGGFVLMNADSDETINNYLLDNTNVKIISIDYPKAPDHPFPSALDAVYEIVSYYYEHADELRIDRTGIGIGGHSAGANLAAAICIRAKQDQRPWPRYQVLDYPPLDLSTSPFDKPAPKGAVDPKMAAMFDAAYVSAEQVRNPLVSPLLATEEMLFGLPPALIIAAGQDSLHDEAVGYADLLRQTGVTTALHDFPKAEHGFTLKPGEDTAKALRLIADFITLHSV
ncbi:alpha/beta hydrolase [uncultured Robinsoniella sp.]|uniref:alpha/beta hydrolase n=1 Tax=uncultured Robinsoniella sp. TaxID=904190 RepID=UPI00374F54CC